MRLISPTVVLLILLICVSANARVETVRFQSKLVGVAIPHEYRQLPGDHSWAYWDQQIPHVLEIAARKMRMPAAKKRAAGA